jgi:hypothetical protein
MVFSQNPCNVRADVSYTNSEKEFKIEVNNRQSNSTLIFYKLSSERECYNYQDSIRIVELREKKWKTAGENKELEQLRNKYKVFEKDSITISNESLIVKYSDSLINYKETILKEKKNQPVYTDAMFVEVFENGNQKYIVSNPDLDNYKWVFYFLKYALNEYWERVSNPILNKEYTGSF